MKVNQKRNPITRVCGNFTKLARVTYAAECKLWSISDKVTSQLINIARWVRLQCRSCIKLANIQAADSFVPDKCSVCLISKLERSISELSIKALSDTCTYAQTSCSEIIYLLRKHQFERIYLFFWDFVSVQWLHAAISSSFFTFGCYLNEEILEKRP